MTSLASAATASTIDRRRWIALVVVCLGQLMIVVDATIVNVALPRSSSDLRFTQSTLTWVVNAYMISFGSFLLLAGRLGDLVGRKRVFLVGLVLFTRPRSVCGFADGPGHAHRRPLRPGHRAAPSRPRSSSPSSSRSSPAGASGRAR